MKRLAKSLELSSCAARRVGPKILRPAARNVSTIPAASGASGPTTVSSTDSFLAKLDQLVDAGDRHVVETIFPRCTGVARRHIDACDAPRLRQTPGDGVLTAAAADNQ